MKIKIDISIKVSRIVKIFIMTDFVLLAGWGLIEPVFSIFIIEHIAGATLVTVGFSAAIYWITKSIMQIPIANFLDRIRNEKVAFLAVIAGLTLGGITAFLFMLIREPWQLYLLQFVHSVAFGLYIPAWSGLFAKHLDKDHFSLDFSLDSTAVGIAAGISGMVGGILANWFGFPIVFIFAGLLTFVAAGVLLSAPHLVFPQAKAGKYFAKDHDALTQ